MVFEHTIRKYLKFLYLFCHVFFEAPKETKREGGRRETRAKAKLNNSLGRLLLCYAVCQLLISPSRLHCCGCDCETSLSSL